MLYYFFLQQIMNQLLNNPEYEFIKSDRAQELYEDIINKILSENTDYMPSKEEEHYFENSGEEFRSNVNNNLNFTKKEKKQILSSTPIQKAKNKYKKDE